MLPKPLMPIGEYPDPRSRSCASWRARASTIITIAVNHQAELIKAFFGDGAQVGLRIDYSLEDQPLGTMGPLRLIRDLPAHFLVMNGDVLTDLDFARLYDDHAQSDAIFTDVVAASARR